MPSSRPDQLRRHSIRTGTADRHSLRRDSARCGTGRRDSARGCAAPAAARARLALLAPLILAGAIGPLCGQDLYLVGGHMVDPETREIRAENLLIVDGAIVGAVDAPPADFQGELLELEGRWVIPGLVDLHTHSFGNQTPVDGVGDFAGTPVMARRMLFAGVTAFLDLFAPEDAMFAMRNRQRDGGMPGADIFASGPCMTAPEGHCSEYGVPTRLMSTPEEARRQVAEVAAKQPDVVKVVYSRHGRMPSIDRETLRAAVDEASSRGIPTVIHIDSWDDVRDAAEAGASAITHVPGDEPIPDDALALLVERRVASIPTLAVQLGLADLSANPDWLDTPLARGTTSAAVLDAYARDDWRSVGISWRERQLAQRATMLHNVRRMHEAGVPVLVGTDAGNLGTIQGWSVHHELMKLVEAGLDPWDALAAGTTRAAAFLDRTYGFAEGAEANLVVLDASPIEDIRNTQRVLEVIHHGVRVDRESLRAP